MNAPSRFPAQSEPRRESRRESVAFFLLGVLGFLTGVIFWIASGRASATTTFACSSVVFAGAWFFERAERHGGPTRRPRGTAHRAGVRQDRTLRE